MAGLYTTALLAVLNSRLKSTVTSYSTTWKDSESRVERGPHTRVIFGRTAVSTQGSLTFARDPYGTMTEVSLDQQDHT